MTEENGMTVLNVFYKMKPGAKEKYLEEVFAAGIPGATANEEGCLCYKFYPSYDADEVLLVEKWESEDCLAAHREQPHFKVLAELKNKWVISTDIEVFEK